MSGGGLWMDEPYPRFIIEAANRVQCSQRRHVGPINRSHARSLGRQIPCATGTGAPEASVAVEHNEGMKFQSESSRSSSPAHSIERFGRHRHLREDFDFIEGDEEEVFPFTLDGVQFDPILEQIIGDNQRYGIFHERYDHAQPATVPFTFPEGLVVELECEVCLSLVTERSRPCCYRMVCKECTSQYFHHKIQEGDVHLTCPGFGCDKPIPREEILSRVKNRVLLEKYRRFLTNANSEPNKKTCPHCCLITQFEVTSRDKFGHSITCKRCEFKWCFECHSPEHRDVKCKVNMDGLKALKAWTRENSSGQRNARKCPKCKLLIQRLSGCDHMTCIQCRTHFCYACGGKHLKARFLFGNHYDRFSVLGCPRNFMDGRRKHLRRVVRGSIFSGKLLAAAVGTAVVVSLLPVAAAAAIFAGPPIGFLRLHRYLQKKKAAKRASKILPGRHFCSEYDIYRQLERIPLEPRRDGAAIGTNCDIEQLIRMLAPMELDNPTDLSSDLNASSRSSNESLSEEYEEPKSLFDEYEEPKSLVEEYEEPKSLFDEYEEPKSLFVVYEEPCDQSLTDVYEEPSDICPSAAQGADPLTISQEPMLLVADKDETSCL